MRYAQEFKPTSWQDDCSARVKPLSFLTSNLTSLLTSLLTPNLTSETSVKEIKEVKGVKGVKEVIACFAG
ncbi:MAG: hypothetical protein J6W21_08620 [Bacteroidaceae bacterium]|nr:hypothetical protein [Bacteroidaceae bacterium]